MEDVHALARARDQMPHQPLASFAYHGDRCAELWRPFPSSGVGFGAWPGYCDAVAPHLHQDPRSSIKACVPADPSFEGRLVDHHACLDAVVVQRELCLAFRAAVVADAEHLKTKNGRNNVKSAPYRPILSANRTRQRPTAVYARADPAQNGGNGGN